MNINQKLQLHNRFDVQVCDAKTGEVKQTAIGYNVILNQFLSWRTVNRNTYALNCIHFGRGTGTTSATRTNMFSRISYKGATTIDTVYKYPTSYITKQIKLEANEYIGESITEVGFGIDGSLATHALLTDAEGNQLTLLKTDVDVIYINATFYVTLVYDGFGNNGLYPLDGHENLTAWIINGIARTRCYASSVDMDANSHDFRFNAHQWKDFSWGDGTGDPTTYTYYSPIITWLDTDFNNHLIKEIGFSQIGCFHFPDISVFPDYNINNLNIGIGDGITTDFNVQCPKIIPNSAKVYKNGIEVPSSEYIFTYNNNCIGYMANSYTAEMTCTDSNIRFGNFDNLLTYDTFSRYLCDPLFYGKKYYPTGSSDRDQISITQDNPIWIDLGEVKPCNYMNIYDYRYYYYGIQHNLSANDYPYIVIEYSNDNENWTAILNKQYPSDTVTNIHFSWDTISARYWRIYKSNGNWTFTISQMGIPDDHATATVSNSFTGENCYDGTIGANFFLGYTTPGLHFYTPPSEGDVIEVSYKINIPYKTSNNLIRVSFSITLEPVEHD